MKIVLLGAPQSTNHLYKSTCRGGRPVVYMDEKAVALKTSYAWEARAQWSRPVFEGTMNVHIKLFFADRRRRDWDNWHKISMDALTGIVWKDDSQIEKATVEKCLDPKNPRIEIFIS